MRLILWDHYDAGMGGIEKLIITLTSELAGTHDIAVIANESGTIVRTLRTQGVPFEIISPCSVAESNAIGHDDLLLDFGAYREFRAIGRANPRFLLWRVFPSVGCRNAVGTRLFSRMFSRLEALDSLVFMDAVCHETACRELKRSYRRTLLPLPITVREKRYVTDREVATVHISYIGRGSRMWKVKPLKKLVNDLGSIPDRRFHVHVFTDTDKLFKSELQPVIAPNVDVEYHFGYTMAALSDKLAAVSDLHYSMGTSSLEGAILGIPTLIADASHRDFPPDYRYRWLVEDLDNYAGVFLENARPPGHTLAEIVTTLLDPRERRRLSDLTHQQCLSHFSSPKIARSIETFSPRARVTDALRFMPSYWLHGGPLRLPRNRRAM